MANKFRIYDEKKNVILDNVTTPINIPVEAGKSYDKGAFTWALINEVGDEIQTGEVEAFVANDSTAPVATSSAAPVSSSAATTSAASSAK